MIAISLQTVRDLLRERILYNVLFLSLFMIFVGFLASQLVYGHQHRVLLHFGTTVAALSVIGVALTVGSRLLRSEWESRNIYLPLSRPISRTSYFFAKALGVSLFLLMNLVLLAVIIALIVNYLGGEFRWVIFQWGALAWIESLLALGLALLLSFAMRPGLAFMSALTFIFVSHNHGQLELLNGKEGTGGGASFNLLSALTPDGTQFFIDTRLYYEIPLTAGELAIRAGYGLMWAICFALLANAAFQRRNL